MKDMFEGLMNKIKDNKATVIRVGGIVIGALVGVVVGTIIANSEEQELLELGEGENLLEDDSESNLEESES